MFNILLDELPTKWRGFPIDSDFQTGIQISQCLADKELTQYERILTAADLLFYDEKQRPDWEEAMEGLAWFMNEFNHDRHEKTNNTVKVMDFDIDQWRIYSAFLNQYHIDLNSTKLHWFTFMGLVSTLEECAFTRVVDIRCKKIMPKMSPEEKRAIKKAKKIYAIQEEDTECLNMEEQRAVDEFLKYANVKNKENGDNHG